MRIDLTVRGPDGTDRDVALLADEPAPFATVSAALRRVLGAGAAADGWCSAGRPIPPHALLGDAGLRHGALLTTAVRTGEPGVPVRVSAGIDAGAQVNAANTVTVGRAADCELVLTDPDVSRRHLLVTRTPTAVTVRDLGSTNGATLGAELIADDPAWPAGGLVRLGDTHLALGSPPTTPAPVREHTDGTVGVRPRSAGPDDPPAPEFIDPDAAEQRRHAGLRRLTALAPIALAAALATMLGSVELLAFALLTPLSLWASRPGGQLGVGRRRRAEAEALRALEHARLVAALQAEAEQRRNEDPDAGTVAGIARLPSNRLWERDPLRPDGLRVRIGVAPRPSRVRRGSPARSSPAATLEALPVSVDLSLGPVGIVAPRPIALAMARWWVCQLAVLTSPARLRFACRPSDDGWHWLQWLRWLPHLDSTDVSPVAGNAWRVRLLDPGSTRLVLGERETAICVAETSAELALPCRQIVRLANESGTRLRLEPDPDAHPAARSPLLADRVTAKWAERVARDLAPLVDDAAEPTNALPDQCTIATLLGPLTADAVAHRWTTSAGWATVVLGVGRDGPLVLDLDRDGPHLLVGGTTGSGKSQLLQTLIGGLAAAHPPDEIAFVLVDYKGGAAFAECAVLPHVTGLVTDLDEGLTRRALDSLRAELRRRESILSAVGASDLAGYRERAGYEALPRLVIVVDEFASLAAELPDFLIGLTAIAQRGRSLGVHLVLATQRPAGVITPAIRSNCSTRIALRVTDPADSRDVVEVPDAAAIPQDRPGRAVLWRDGRAEPLQVARADLPVRDPLAGGVQVQLLDAWRRPVGDGVTPHGPTELQALVDAVVEAARAGGRARARAPWLPPLPELVTADELIAPPGATSVALGLLDIPTEQAQRALTLDLAAGGGLLVVGSAASGRTTALVSLAVAAARRWSPDELHVHAVDPVGAALDRLVGLPHLASVVGPARLMPAWAELVGDLIAELAAASFARPDRTRPWQLLLVDGWDDYVRAAHEARGSADELLALARAAPSLGLTVAVTGDRAALSPRLFGVLSTRLVLRLADRGDYAFAGLPTRVTVPSTPGRALLVPSAQEVQLAVAGRDAEDIRRAIQTLAARSVPRRETAVLVRPLPERVGIGDLPERRDALVFAVSAPYGRAIALPLRPGGRFLVAGPPRSGRSTVLRTLVRQGIQAGCPVTVVAAPRSPVALLGRELGLDVLGPGDQPPSWPLPPAGLTVVDDAETYAGTDVETALLDHFGSNASGPGSWLVVAARSDDLAASFRGLASEVRRDRCGLLLRPGAVDGDLLGVRVRSASSDDPPGRGVLVGHPDWGPEFATGPIRVQAAQP